MRTTTTISFWSWTWNFNHHTSLCTVLQTIPTLSISQRKDLLGLCRSQTPPVSGSHCLQGMKHTSDTILVPRTPEKFQDRVVYIDMTFLDFIFQHIGLFLNHLSASILSSGLRVSPGITNTDFETTLAQSVSKEISAAISITPLATFDFSAIFDSKPSRRHRPFTDRLEPNPEVSQDTHQRLLSIRSSLQNTILFPTLGSKTVGRLVEESFWSIYWNGGLSFKHEEGTAGEGVTTTDCYRAYFLTGDYPKGPVEMRTAWTYNQLEPRVYYARGGDVMKTSQYVQLIANRLVDMFPETHRKDRFQPPTDILKPDDVEVIYDYSSFTSCLDAVIPFLDALSSFFDGVMVSLVDIREGLVTTDLGELLREYNTACNCYADFDASRVLGKELPGTFVLQHTCGMLGVEGNIFFATLLHGLHIRFIAGMNRSRCVGDDARFHNRTEDGTLASSELELLHHKLSGCGVLNASKVGLFEHDVDSILQAGRYVKRPLHRDQDFMVEGILLTLPSITSFGPLDNFHTFHPSSTHPSRKAYSQILRFIQELYVYSLDYKEGDLTWKAVLRHLMFMRAQCVKLDPNGDHSMYKSSSHLTHYRFPPVEVWGKMPVEDWIIGDIGFDELVKFPRYGESENEGECDGRVGSVMTRKGSAARGFLVKLGFLRKTDLFDTVSIETVGDSFFKMYLAGDYVSISNYEVIVDVPEWFAQVPRTL